MDIKDIAYRAGLVLAAFLLAGIFANQLFMASSEADFKEARQVAASLAEALGALMSSPGGSGMVVSFGLGEGQSEGALLLPGRLGGEYYRVLVLPGSLFIEWNGGRERVLEHPSIIPSHRVANSLPMNSTQLSNLKSMVVPFGPMTPCKLWIYRTEWSSCSLFLYRGDDPGLASVIAMGELLDNPPKQFPGSAEEACLEVADGGIVRDRLLVLNGDDDPDKSGPDCSVPFVLPGHTSIEMGGRSEVEPGSKLVLRRETVLRPDGNCTLLTRLIISSPPR